MNNLIRFNPTADLRRMQREFDRVFDSFFPGRVDSGADAETSVWSPRVDLVENDNAYLIHLDLPGVQKDDLKINFQDGMLSVSGERRIDRTDENSNFVRVERSYGHFFRSFNLPKAVDVDRIEARHENGVLTINVPKAEESKPRQINVA